MGSLARVRRPRATLAVMSTLPVYLPGLLALPSEWTVIQNQCDWPAGMSTGYAGQSRWGNMPNALPALPALTTEYSAVLSASSQSSLPAGPFSSPTVKFTPFRLWPLA